MVQGNLEGNEIGAKWQSNVETAERRPETRSGRGDDTDTTSRNLDPQTALRKREQNGNTY
jgi:hypothetical protein